MKFARFDLNLLKTLDVLERERSVQEAAAQLNVTASAVSHALARLRRDLDDPLFARSGQGLVPTQRCMAIVRKIRPFLAAVALSLEGSPGGPPDSFDPASDRRTVAVAMPGAVELSLLPPLTERLRSQAPGWTMVIKGFQRRSYEADLLSGDVDVVLSVGGHTPNGEGILVSALWQDELVALQAPGGPLPKGVSVSLDQLIEYPQIYPVPWPRTQNYLDIRLAREGRQRALTVSLPSYAALGAILSRTDLVASMPDRTALAILRHHPDLELVRVVPPLQNTLVLETSKLFGHSQPGQWFLSELRAAATEVPGLCAQTEV